MGGTWGRGGMQQDNAHRQQGHCHLFPRRSPERRRDFTRPGNLLHFAIENDHKNSGFTHEKSMVDLSIVFW